MTKPMTDERLEELEESDNDTTFEMTQEIHRLREDNKQTRNDWNSMRAEVDGAAIEICRLKEVNKNNVANYQLQVTALRKAVDVAYQLLERWYYSTVVKSPRREPPTENTRDFLNEHEALRELDEDPNG